MLLRNSKKNLSSLLQTKVYLDKIKQWLLLLAVYLDPPQPRLVAGFLVERNQQAPSLEISQQMHLHKLEGFLATKVRHHLLEVYLATCQLSQLHRGHFLVKNQRLQLKAVVSLEITNPLNKMEEAFSETINQVVAFSDKEVSQLPHHLAAVSLDRQTQPQMEACLVITQLPQLEVCLEPQPPTLSLARQSHKVHFLATKRQAGVYSKTQHPQFLGTQAPIFSRKMMKLEAAMTAKQNMRLILTSRQLLPLEAILSCKNPHSRKYLNLR
jgi:hypothetical protein